MKKTRLIIAVAVAALMVMGVGYALWDQTLYAEANGDYAKLDMSIVGSDTPGVGGSAILSNDGKSIVLSSNSPLKPGSTDSYVIKVQNTGDIYAVLEGLTLTGKDGKTDGLYVDVYYRPTLAGPDFDRVGGYLPSATDFSAEGYIALPPTGLGVSTEYYIIICVGLPYEFSDETYMGGTYKLNFEFDVSQDPYGY